MEVSNFFASFILRYANLTVWNISEVCTSNLKCILTLSFPVRFVDAFSGVSLSLSFSLSLYLSSSIFLSLLSLSLNILFVCFTCSTRSKMSDWPADANNSDYQEEEQANRSNCWADEHLLREVSTLSASTRRSTVTEGSRETEEFRAAEKISKLS